MTEIEILLTPNQTFVPTFAARFSILSPSTVIDQTFDFLTKLNSKRSLTVYDSQINSKVLTLDIEGFNRIKKMFEISK